MGQSCCIIWACLETHCGRIHSTNDDSSKTTNSFRTMVCEAKKKIRLALEKTGGSSAPANSPEKPKSAGSRKRKAATDDPESPANTKKKRTNVEKLNTNGDEEVRESGENDGGMCSIRSQGTHGLYLTVNTTGRVPIKSEDSN